MIIWHIICLCMSIIFRIFTTMKNYYNMFEFDSDTKKIIDEFVEIRKDSDFYSIAKKINFSFKKDLNKYVYFYKVWKITEQNAHLIKDIGKRGADYHLDHIIPINSAYLYGIDYKLIGSINNLQIISREENFKKGSLFTDKVKELFSFFNIDYRFLQRINHPKIELKNTNTELKEQCTKTKKILDFGCFTSYPDGGDW